MKRFLLLLAAVLVVGAVIGIVMWNKPHEKAESQKGIAVMAEELYSAFQKDEAAANKTYLNKVIVVSGELLSSEKNQDGQAVAVLRGAAGDDLLSGGIMCTLREKDAALPKGPKVTLKGFCNGYTGDVHLSDCIIQ